MDEALTIELRDINTKLQDLNASLASEINQLSDDAILRGVHGELAHIYLSKYEVTVPSWEENQITIDKPEATDVNVTPEIERWNKYSNDSWKKGRVIKVRVPLAGNLAVLDRFVRLNGEIDDGRKRAFLSNSVLELRYTRLDHDASALKADIDKDLNDLRTKLATLQASATEYNIQLPLLIEEHLRQRRDIAEADLLSPLLWATHLSNAPTHLLMRSLPSIHNRSP